YTKDTPNYHALGDLPLDLPWLRSTRIGAAEAARDAARYRFAFERAAIRFDIDTTYSRSLAAAIAGQLENIALDDSLAALDVLLSLQLQMGLTGDAPAIALADSLIAP